MIRWMTDFVSAYLNGRCVGRLEFWLNPKQKYWKIYCFTKEIGIRDNLPNAKRLLTNTIGPGKKISWKVTGVNLNFVQGHDARYISSIYQTDEGWTWRTKLYPDLNKAKQAVLAWKRLDG